MLLRQMIVIMSFMLVLLGIVSGVVVVEKTTERQMVRVEKIIESANEIN